MSQYYKVLKDFTTPLHRFKAGQVIAAADVDGPLGVDHYRSKRYIELDKAAEPEKSVVAAAGAASKDKKP